VALKIIPYLKKSTKINFQKVFKKILWNRQLTDAGKVFAFSLLTVPPQSNVKLKKLAKKLGKDPAVISRMKKQLSTAKVHIRDYEKLIKYPYMPKKSK
jgi:hypothetical protein